MTGVVAAVSAGVIGGGVVAGWSQSVRPVCGGVGWSQSMGHGGC
jgi:hypothetical protein